MTVGSEEYGADPSREESLKKSPILAILLQGSKTPNRLEYTNRLMDKLEEEDDNFKKQHPVLALRREKDVNAHLFDARRNMIFSNEAKRDSNDEKILKALWTAGYQIGSYKEVKIYLKEIEMNLRETEILNHIVHISDDMKKRVRGILKSVIRYGVREARGYSGRNEFIAPEDVGYRGPKVELPEGLEEQVENALKDKDF